MFLFIVLSFLLSTAETQVPKRIQAMKVLTIPAAVKCVDQEGLPVEFLHQRDDGGILSKSAACFFACFLKDIGILEEDGDYNATKAFKSLKPFLEADVGPNELWKYEETLKTCSYVSDLPNPPNDKRQCGKAWLVINCIRAKGKQLDDFM